MLDPSLQIMTNLKEGNLEDAMDKCTNAVTELASPQKSMSMGGGGVGAVAKRALLEASHAPAIAISRFAPMQSWGVSAA